MDDVIYWFNQHALTVLLVIAIIKIIVILLYKGPDFIYVLENFLIVYTTLGIEYNPSRKRFRVVHNVLTIGFYFVALAWLTVGAVLSVTK